MTHNADSERRFLPPEHELEERFITAGGPGGQHVNRTATAVQLRFNVAASGLRDDIKRRLLALAGRRATLDGVIVIEARTHRSQQRNREAARDRLAALIERAHRVPGKRIATRPTRAARRKRLQDKRKTGQVKRMRRTPGKDE